MVRPIASRIALLVITSCVAASCAGPHRDEVIEDPALNQGLEFLREQGVARGAVETRLGSPRTTFEDGRVVVYRVHMEDGVELKSVVSEAWWRPRGLQLIIEYDKDGKVLRHNVLR